MEARQYCTLGTNIPVRGTDLVNHIRGRGMRGQIARYGSGPTRSRLWTSCTHPATRTPLGPAWLQPIPQHLEVPNGSLLAELSGGSSSQRAIIRWGRSSPAGRCCPVPPAEDTDSVDDERAWTVLVVVELQVLFLEPVHAPVSHLEFALERAYHGAETFVPESDEGERFVICFKTDYYICMMSF